MNIKPEEPEAALLSRTQPRPRILIKGVTMMKRSTKDKAKGKLHEIKGKVKEKAGQLTNDRGLQARGKVEKAAGKVQGKLGQVEKALGR